jgi:hypothetical protein
MALELAKTAISYLKERPEEKFTARQIAEWVFATFTEECQAKKKSSAQTFETDTDFVQQLVAEIGAHRQGIQKRCPEVKTTEGRPREYYYSEKSDSAEVAAIEGVTTASGMGIEQPKRGEFALYPLLAQYLWEEFDHHLYSKRIDEKRSSNKQGKEGNHWLHPDMVGLENLSAGWDKEVRDCVDQYSDKRTRLWSFEVKQLINRSNVRNCFFQAVSNSSWANFGYLVAAQISRKEQDNTLKELRMLSAAHGIGVIQLKADDPAESLVLIPARERDEIDWDMVNRLAKENKDFLEYVKRVKQFYQTGEVHPADWDIPRVED